MSAGASCALRRAALITASCAGPLGTVSPLLRPSELTALPRITARMGSPAATASGNRLRAITAQPSARTKPSAAASKVLQCPSGAIMPHFENSTIASGESTTLTPPASARLLSPARRLWQARCTATRDEEQAVSIETQGPCRPSVNAMRPAAASNGTRSFAAKKAARGAQAVSGTGGSAGIARCPDVRACSRASARSASARRATARSVSA